MTQDQLSDEPAPSPLAAYDDAADRAADRAAGRDWRPAIAAALLAALLFGVTLGGTYVYDDVHILFADARIREGAWAKIWTQPYFPYGLDNLYRPLVTSSYALQWQLHGDRPWAFHLVNVLLHAAASAAVAELARRVGGTRVAYVAGLLFAAHPIHVEAVANIVGRAELMCTAAMATALALFATRWPMTLRRGLAILICFAVAVLSKEQGLVLPIILAAWCAARWAWDEKSRATARPAVALVATMGLLLCAYVALREHMFTFSWDRGKLDWTLNPMVRAEGMHRLLMPLVLLGWYASLLAAPLKLSPDYGGEIIGWIVRPSDPHVWIGAAVVVAWCAAMLLAVRRRSVTVALLLMGLALTYGMVSNVVIIGINLGERLMYLPSAFLLVMVALAVARMERRTAFALVALALSLASLRTVTYAKRWNDRLDFYMACLEEQPKSPRLYILVSDELSRRGEVATANAVIAEGRRAMPDYWVMWIQSAQMATDQGDLTLAVEYLNQAVKVDPTQQMFFASLIERIEKKHAEMRTAQVELK